MKTYSIAYFLGNAVVSAFSLSAVIAASVVVSHAQDCTVRFQDKPGKVDVSSADSTDIGGYEDAFIEATGSCEAAIGLLTTTQGTESTTNQAKCNSAGPDCKFKNGIKSTNCAVSNCVLYDADTAQKCTYPGSSFTTGVDQNGKPTVDLEGPGTCEVASSNPGNLVDGWTCYAGGEHDITDYGCLPALVSPH